MKTNRQLNTEHDQREQDKVRPKQPTYNFKTLEEVVRKWVKQNEQRKVVRKWVKQNEQT